MFCAIMGKSHGYDNEDKWKLTPKKIKVQSKEDLPVLPQLAIYS